jgi:hypothetical protein
MRNAMTRLIIIPKDAFQKCFQQWRKRWEEALRHLSLFTTQEDRQLVVCDSIVGIILPSSTEYLRTG